MTTLAQWVAETRDYLDGSRTEEGNQLAQAYVAGSGTVTVSNPLGNIAANSFLSIGTNTLLVTAVNPLTKVASVIGGQRGSTDADAAAGTMVRVNPRFTDYQIVLNLNRHLSTMSSPRVGLYRVAVTELTYAGWVEGYDLTGVTNLIRLLEVRRQTWGPSLAWPVVQAEGWDLVSMAPTSDFPSGLALRLVGANTGRQVQVVYATGFTRLWDLDEDVSATGVTTDMEDIPPLGAAIRLMSGREIPRSSPTSQGDARRSDEVGSGSMLRAYQGLAIQWQERTREESARLRNRYAVSI